MSTLIEMKVPDIGDIEEAEIIEIKQGPYMGVDDKIKFNL